MSKRSKYLVFSLATIWCIAMLVLAPRFVAVEREKKSVDEAFTGYAAALTRHDFHTAYELCGSPFHRAMSYDDFVDQQATLESKYGAMKNYKKVGYQLSSVNSPPQWRAVVTAEFKFERSVVNFQLEFRKEDDHWVLFGYRQL